MRTKHIEIDFHVARDKVSDGIVHLMFVTSKEWIADNLTKSLRPSPFYNLQAKLGMIEIHSTLSGDVESNYKIRSS